MAETRADPLSPALPEGWVGFCVLWSSYPSRAPPSLTLVTRHIDHNVQVTREEESL